MHADAPVCAPAYDAPVCAPAREGEPGEITGGENIHPDAPYTPPPWDEVLAGLGADAAHARGLARKLQECENARAIDHEWSCIQKGNYRSLGDPAQAAIRCVYDDHRRQLVAGGAR